MRLSEASVTSQLPEYLVTIKELNEKKEVLEQIVPTTITTTSALLDKACDGLRCFNNWTNGLSNYKEFKLDKIYGDGKVDALGKVYNIGNLYALNDSELTKTFYTFKGTYADLNYISNVSQLEIAIRDADYFDDFSFNTILEELSSKDKGSLDKFIYDKGGNYRLPKLLWDEAMAGSIMMIRNNNSIGSYQTTYFVNKVHAFTDIVETVDGITMREIPNDNSQGVPKYRRTKQKVLNRDYRFGDDIDYFLYRVCLEDATVHEKALISEALSEYSSLVGNISRMDCKICADITLIS